MKSYWGDPLEKSCSVLICVKWMGLRGREGIRCVTE